MSLTALADFTRTFGPASLSARSSMYVRNVEQGGNHLLSTVPKAAQAAYACPVLRQVSKVVQGPLKWVAQGFSLLFNPLVCLPLSILSSSVRARAYESSVAVPLL